MSMSLIEKRASYMRRLQELIDARQKSIDDKVSAFRAKLEAEQIQPYRAQLEAEKVTPEMSKLVEFINNIDAMLEYEKTEAEATSTDDVEQSEEANEDVEVEQTTECVEETTNETETFREEVEVDTKNDVNANQCTAASKATEELIGTGFEAIAADIADTKAKLHAAVESRPGMPGIVLPRR